MFGYVTPLKTELKVKDLAKFKSYYCGLCFHIKNNFGNIPRIALNYDLTFLGILLDSISPNEVNIEIKRCGTHPTKKKPIVMNNNALSYSSSMNLSLVYYKLLDDVQDDNNLKSKLGTLLLYPYKKKFSNDINLINELIFSRLQELSKLENEKNFTSIDEISHPFSDILGNILKLYPYSLCSDSESLRKNLYDLGYSLGKWIYIIDALDDLKEDIEKQKFNPINYLFNKENLPYDNLINDIKPRIEFTILNSAFNCKEYLSKLPLRRNEDILFNIIELGMMDKYINVVDTTCKTCKNKRSDFNNESI